MAGTSWSHGASCAELIDTDMQFFGSILYEDVPLTLAPAKVDARERRSREIVSLDAER